MADIEAIEILKITEIFEEFMGIAAKVTSPYGLPKEINIFFSEKALMEFFDTIGKAHGYIKEGDYKAVIVHREDPRFK